VELVERGEVLAIRGLSHCVRLPKHVAERQARAAERLIREKLPGVPVKIDLEYYEPGRDPHLGPGSGIVVYAETEKSILGGDALGAKGKRAEVVGEEAARKLLEDLETGMALDRHASDMLIPFAALAKGVSRLGGARLTLHAYTNLLVVEKLTGVRYRLEGEMEKPFRLEVEGIGLER
jgi:RNA 3'-terminal phosphate cyclase (ATP)